MNDYQDRCPVCNLVCTRHRHRHDIISNFVIALKNKNNNSSNSAFAKYIIKIGYSVGKIDDFLDVVYITRKGKQLDAMEKEYTFM
jgi:hypothetical protein